MDTYYAYDFNKPARDYRLPFIYNHNRHNEFNLNLGLLKVEVEHAKYRATLALQAGTYAQDNYAAEQDMLKPVYEAHAGVALNQGSTLWLDAGILPSNLGFESAISTENPTLTRSLLAENSPYFLAGARLSYAPDSKWYVAALVSNGWQRIQRVPGNSLLSFGTQLSYSPTASTLLNWSTFIGTDSPDAARKMRYFNDFYAKFALADRLHFIAGFDVGFEQKQKGSNSYNTWYSPILITRYTFDREWAIGLRAEYYADKYNVIVAQPNNIPFKTAGFSANLDYMPAPAIMCRLESRWFTSPNSLFLRDGRYVGDNVALVGSIAVKLSR